MRVVFATACSPDGRSPQSCGRPRGVMRAGLLVRVLERAVHTDRGRRPPRPGREVSGASGGHSATRPAPAAGRSPLPRGGHFTGPTLRHFVYSRAGPARESPILPSLRSVQELGTRLKTTSRWRRTLPTIRTEPIAPAHGLQEGRRTLTPRAGSRCSAIEGASAASGGRRAERSGAAVAARWVRTPQGSRPPRGKSVSASAAPCTPPEHRGMRATPRPGGPDGGWPNTEVWAALSGSRPSLGQSVPRSISVPTRPGNSSACFTKRLAQISP